MAKQQVPGPAQENNERIRSRSYEDGFSEFPAEEVDAIDHPGAGPQGTLDDGRRNLPLVVIAIGFVVAFLSLGYNSIMALIAGVVLVVAGAIWAGIARETTGNAAGTGPVVVEEDTHP